jgi:hypothetical protein
LYRVRYLVIADLASLLNLHMGQTAQYTLKGRAGDLKKQNLGSEGMH